MFIEYISPTLRVSWWKHKGSHLCDERSPSQRGFFFKTAARVCKEMCGENQHLQQVSEADRSSCINVEMCHGLNQVCFRLPDSVCPDIRLYTEKPRRINDNAAVLRSKLWGFEALLRDKELDSSLSCRQIGKRAMTRQ